MLKPATMLNGIFNDHFQNVKIEVWRDLSAGLLVGEEAALVDIANSYNSPAEDAKIIFFAMLLRTYAFSPNGTSVLLSHQKYSFVKLFFGWIEGFSKTEDADYEFKMNRSSVFEYIKKFTKIAFKIILTPLIPPLNLLRFVTEIIPGFLHHSLHHFLFATRDLRNGWLQQKSSKASFIGTNKLTAMVLFLPWLATLALYAVGRAITSPAESMQAALEIVTDEFNHKRPWLATLITMPFVLGSLAATAVSYAVGAMFAIQLYGAATSFLPTGVAKLVNTVSAFSKGVAASVNSALGPGVISALSTNVGLASEVVTLGFFAGAVRAVYAGFMGSIKSIFRDQPSIKATPSTTAVIASHIPFYSLDPHAKKLTVIDEPGATVEVDPTHAPQEDLLNFPSTGDKASQFRR